jgi:hypothetical protein
MPPIPDNAQTTDLTSLAGRLSAAWHALNGRTPTGPQLPFSPGKPIAPQAAENEQAFGPRQFQYPVSVNTVITPRTEYPTDNLISFQQLRALASLYNIANICVNVRIEEMQSLDWGIVPRDSRDQERLKPNYQRVERWFQSPDGSSLFDEWLGSLLRDLFEIDAWTMFPERTRDGTLGALTPIDGTTIKPLLNGRGQVAGYQQIYYGAPRTQYMDVNDEELPSYWLDPITRKHQMYYWPYWTSLNSPYGSPPAEALILTINTALRKQNQDMLGYTEGNIPFGLASPPTDTMNPEQLRQFEAAFNADLAGVDRSRVRIKFLPWKMDYQAIKPFEYGTELDDWMMKTCCARFGVTPAEIGFTDKIVKSTGETQGDVQQRRSLLPMSKWLERRLTHLIAHELGEPDLEFKFVLGGTEDKAQQAQTDQIYIVNGVVTPEEVRVMRFPDLDGQAPTEAPPDPVSVGKAIAKRKRNRKRALLDVDDLLESQAAGALDWAKKARAG